MVSIETKVKYKFEDNHFLILLRIPFNALLNIFIYLLGQQYEPTSACPSETEEGNLSDGREDDVEVIDGSLYQKSSNNPYSRPGMISVQDIPNETSMADINHDEASQLTDVEEEEDEQKGEIINASTLRNNRHTSNTSHNAELKIEHCHCSVETRMECSHTDAGSQRENSSEHCDCNRQDSEPSPILSEAYCCAIAPECHKSLELSTFHCSRMSQQMHGEAKPTDNQLTVSNIPNEELTPLISCQSTTNLAHLEESLNDANPDIDCVEEQTQKALGISSQFNQDDICATSVNPSSINLKIVANESSSEMQKIDNTPTRKLAKCSPIASTSASANIRSPHIPHCVCHSHVQHHHHIHHAPIHPPLIQKDIEVSNVSNSTPRDELVGGAVSDISLQKTSDKPADSGKTFSGPKNAIKSPSKAIQGTTQDAMTADNVDEIVHDHDVFGTDENEDSLDSVATLSLNETAVCQDYEEIAHESSFNFGIKIENNVEGKTSKLGLSRQEECASENILDISGGLSGTKRKTEECLDVSGPSNIKKKRTAAISRSNSIDNVQESSLLNSTPTSAPRTLHNNPMSMASRGVSDVNMASTAFHLDEEDNDKEVEENDSGPIESSKQDRKNERRTAGRQRYWSAGTLHTEEEICAVTNNADVSHSPSTNHPKSDSLDIVSGLSTCETASLALPCSISSSKNVFANVHNICRSTHPCCTLESCTKTLASEEICLSEHEERKGTDFSSYKTLTPYPNRENIEDNDITSHNSNQAQTGLYDKCDCKCYATNLHATEPSLLGSSEETTSYNNFQMTHSAHQQLTNIIPDKNHPPDDILDWKDCFSRWSNAKRLLAIDQLINMCEPQQVRHMMAVIEPQFQRDFISLLPKELALYVLSFLKPRDLLNAAQTCRYWRILAEDNLLWREKCREAGLGDSVAEMFNLRAKSHCKKVTSLAGIDYSSWKLGFMREHNIECNWRVRSIRTTKVLKGHDDHVITCLQFSNNKIVSGSDDNTLKVWNASTGRCLRTLVGHTGGVWSSQMEGNTIVSGSTDRSLKVWNAETGECVHTLYGHTSTVRCMHLHNNLVVSGSRDATLRMWDIKSGECLHVLMGHVAAVRCVQYDGRLVVSGAYDYMVKVIM